MFLNSVQESHLEYVCTEILQFDTSFSIFSDEMKTSRHSLLNIVP